MTLLRGRLPRAVRPGPCLSAGLTVCPSEWTPGLLFEEKGSQLQGLDRLGESASGPRTPCLLDVPPRSLVHASGFPTGLEDSLSPTPGEHAGLCHQCLQPVVGRTDP